MKPLQILLIEDDAIETMKFSRVIANLEQSYDVINATDGEDALDKLSDAIILPDLVLMDLNMPKLDGISFLNVLKKDKRLFYLPCVVLTTSSNPLDLRACYEAGIAGYMVKPLKYEDYIDTIKKTLDYWQINKLVTRT